MSWLTVCFASVTMYRCVEHFARTCSVFTSNCRRSKYIGALAHLCHSLFIPLFIPWITMAISEFHWTSETLRKLHYSTRPQGMEHCYLSYQYGVQASKETNEYCTKNQTTPTAESSPIRVKIQAEPSALDMRCRAAPAHLSGHCNVTPSPNLPHTKPRTGEF